MNTTTYEDDHLMIELMRPVTLYAESAEQAPQYFNQGTLLRVLMRAPHVLLVENDQHLGFKVSLSDENRIWHEF